MGDPKGVTFSYKGLDPSAAYVVRISVGVHLEGQEAEMLKDVSLTEGIQADGISLSDGFSIPRDAVSFYEFPIPARATQDGKVTITLVSKLDVMPITGINEIWLMKKDQMPWTIAG